MTSQRVFERQIPIIDSGLTVLAAIICLSGIVFIIKMGASELSVMNMIVSMVIALTIYLFKVLVIGLCRSLLTLSEDGRITPKPTMPASQIKLTQKKVSNFGLCTFCNQFETKNTLSGRYVCSDCYQIFLKVKQSSSLISAVPQAMSGGKKCS